MFYLILCSLIILILFFPIRVKINIIYQDKFLHIYFFNKEVHRKEKTKVNAKNTKKSTYTLDRLFPKSVRSTFINLSKNPFKPKLKLKFEINYGFEDAALTGLFYGIFGGLNRAIYHSFDSMCKITGFEFNVHPDFKKPMFNFRINSIFSFNLAKIIYMLKIIYFH